MFIYIYIYIYIYEPCGKKTYWVCDSISTTTTFTTEASQETFKIQKVSLNCDSEKVLYLLKCKVCGGVPMLGKQKPILLQVQQLQK